MKHRYSFYIPFINLGADLVMLNLAYFYAYFFKYETIKGAFTDPYLNLWFLLNVLWLILVLIVKPYFFSRVRFNLSYLQLKFLTLFAIHLAAISLFITGTQAYYYSRIFWGLMYLIFFVSGSLWRFLFVWSLRQYRLRGYNSRNFIVLGSGGDLERLIIHYHLSKPELGLRHMGSFGKESEYKWRGDLANVYSFLDSQEVDLIYYCVSDIKTDGMKDIVNLAQRHECELKIMVDSSSFSQNRIGIEYHDYIPVLNLLPKPFYASQEAALKRTFDILFSGSVLILGFPFLSIIALITKISSEGPVFFSQERVGLMGKPFKIYKFRSMVTEAEKDGPALSTGDDDSRITPWGRIMRKTRLDELPQFYNVLTGDMSIVGPRPERQFFIDQIVLNNPEYLNLLRFKPGITSVGQVKFGYASDLKEMVERMQYDLTYSPSFRQDLNLILQTMGVMALGKGK